MFGTVDKSRPPGVTFPIATDDKEVLIILNREALEPALIPMRLPSGPVMGVVAHGVGQGHPAEEVAHSPILGWLPYEVPVIRHKLIAPPASSARFGLGIQPS